MEAPSPSAPSAISHLRVATLRRSILLRRKSAAATAGHGLDVRTVLEWLVEVADAAGYVSVAGDGEGNDGNPTKGKPGMALGDAGSHVTAVMTLEHLALVAGYFLAESVLATHEEEEHAGGDGDGDGGRELSGGGGAKKTTGKRIRKGESRTARERSRGCGGVYE